jgi:hypothetical protein
MLRCPKLKPFHIELASTSGADRPHGGIGGKYRVNGQYRDDQRDSAGYAGGNEQSALHRMKPSIWRY